MDVLIGDERYDYLLADESMRIIQSPSVFSYSIDAVLLAHFAYVPIRKGKILDLCTGNGVIPLLLSRRSNAEIIGVDIQSRLIHMAKRSIRLNGLSSQISMIHGDLKEMHSTLDHSRFDVITCNPPYFEVGAGQIYNKNDYLTIARHEVACTLKDVIRASKFHVRPGGKVAIVHRPGRLVDIITLLRSYRLEPKRLQFVYPKIGREANMILVEGVRDEKADMKILPPLYLYNEDDTYTKEAKDIIYGHI